MESGNCKSMARPKNILAVGEVIHLWFKKNRNFLVTHLFNWVDRNIDQIRYVIRKSLEVYHCAFKDGSALVSVEKRGRPKSLLTEEQEERICISLNNELLLDTSCKIKLSGRLKELASKYVSQSSWTSYHVQNFKRRNKFDGNLFTKVFEPNEMKSSDDLLLSESGKIEMLSYGTLVGLTEPDAQWAAKHDELMFTKKRKRKAQETIDKIVEGSKFGKILATLSAANAMEEFDTTSSIAAVVVDSNPATFGSLHDTNITTIGSCISTPQNGRFSSVKGGTFYQMPLSTGSTSYQSSYDINSFGDYVQTPTSFGNMAILQEISEFALTTDIFSFDHLNPVFGTLPSTPPTALRSFHPHQLSTPTSTPPTTQPLQFAAPENTNCHTNSDHFEFFSDLFDADDDDFVSQSQPPLSCVTAVVDLVDLMNKLSVLNDYLRALDMPFSVVQKSSVSGCKDLADFDHIPSNHLLIKPSKKCHDSFYAILLGSIITRRYFRSSQTYTTPFLLKRRILISLIHAPTPDKLEKFRMYTNKLGKNYKFLFNRPFGDLSSDDQDCVAVDFKHAVLDSLEEVVKPKMPVLEDAVEHAAKVLGVRLEVMTAENGLCSHYNTDVVDNVSRICVKLVKFHSNRYIGSLDVSELDVESSYAASDINALRLISIEDLSVDTTTPLRSHYPAGRCKANVKQMIK